MPGRGDVIAGRFALEREAGSGGMGTVWRAIDVRSSGPVAVKLLSWAHPAALERFEREARVLAELDHPGIVRYVASGSNADGSAWIAMEWLEGETLSALLERSSLPLQGSLKLAARAARALGHAHARGVVHRDVKPANLFLVGGSVEEVKVLDFGIARVRELWPTMTASGTQIGTPGYMSPEQARGDSLLDARTDVFALGCVLYLCLTGRPAYSGASPMAVLAKVLFEDVGRISAVAPMIPAALDELVARMLSKDPAGRPADGSAVAPAIEALLGEDLEAARVVLVAGGGRELTAEALTTGERRLVSIAMARAGRPTAALPTVDRRAQTADVQAPATREASPDLDDVVRQLGARLDRLGDGTVLAVVTGPGSATDLAARGARAALALRSALGAVPLALATGGAEIEGRGPAGETIDRAADLLCGGDGAAPGVFLDDVTAGLLDGRFEVDWRSSPALLVRERDTAEVPRTLLGKTTPFVGRDRELAMIESMLDECLSELVCRAVLVTAPAGMGKSRLRHEVMSRARARTAELEVWEAWGDPTSAGSPFGMVAKALRRAAGARDGEPLAARQEKLLELANRTRSPTRVAEFLGEVTGAPFDDADRVELRAARRDPILMADQIQRAWIELIASRPAPLVLLFEDLHWGDLASVRLVDGVLRGLGNRSVLVLALARPEVHDLFPRLWGDRGVLEVRLAELTGRAGERLVRDVLGSVSDTTVATILERAAGNPFFLEELIRAVAAGREDEPPQSIVAMVQARLERLPDEERRILRAGSVFGGRFWRGGLVALLGVDPGSRELDASLRHLEREEVMARRPESRLQSEVEYSFRHAIIRDAAYETLTDADRVRGHRLAADWLEGAGEVDALALAEHHESGGARERALDWFHRAADQALEGCDWTPAIDRAQRAIECGATGPELGRLRVLQLGARRWRGEWEGLERRAEEATALVEEGGPDWYTAYGLLLIACGVHERTDDLERHARRILEARFDGSSVAARVDALGRALWALSNSARFDLVRTLLEGARRTAAEVLEREPIVTGTVYRAIANTALFEGDLELALDRYGASAEWHERGGDLRNGCVSRGSAGYVRMLLGRFEEASDILRESLAMAERMDLKSIVATQRHNLGLTRARLGDLAGALAIEEAAAAAFTAEGHRGMESIARAYLATIHLLAGDAARARQEARGSLEAAGAAPSARSYSLAILARVLLREGGASEALGCTRESVALLEGVQQMEEGDVLIRLVHVEALVASRDEDGARAAIEIARARVLERAARIRDESLRASFLGRVPENAETLRLARELLD
ncbi:MAG: protein kinase [Deltaproteobacteria bacterium]|nr:protein kinase [Deltaproteobacteria bacterium]